LGSFYTAQPDYNDIIASYERHPMGSIEPFSLSIPSDIKFSFWVLQSGFNPIYTFRPLSRKFVFYLLASSALIKAVSEATLPESYVNPVKSGDRSPTIYTLIIEPIFINGFVSHKGRILHLPFSLEINLKNIKFFLA
jgi:hypothetical protein